MAIFTGRRRVIFPASDLAGILGSRATVAGRSRLTLVDMAAISRVASIFQHPRLVSLITTLTATRSLENPAYLV